jgi:tRNA A22 N-methylase
MSKKDFNINDTVIVKDEGRYYNGIGIIAFIKESEYYKYCVKLLTCGKHLWCKDIEHFNKNVG